jgi:hypothetical protein
VIFSCADGETLHPHLSEIPLKQRRLHVLVVAAIASALAVAVAARPQALMPGRSAFRTWQILWHAMASDHAGTECCAA